MTACQRICVPVNRRTVLVRNVVVESVLSGPVRRTP